MPKLVDLDPHWVSYQGRESIGLSCDCPCGCGSRMFIPFRNPPDGGVPYDGNEHPTWVRTGEDFSSMSLQPSIQRNTDCRWHGFLTNGEMVSV